ncbi:hypothetical protein BO99DRAFT_80376 [Aspergillus violaceofuscus CBS 115571]|uniref:Uncharacterized protein n=1 Tax=Aspergillus violaceofuscus (strain CBS 115571) TaxID=1450538 RepID=A0A2V5HH96_ASPV1|nr:hypothetical protein BO99DRAFT_80376 [Aspergillus violaceofuscus CBS 115571]
MGWLGRGETERAVSPSFSALPLILAVMPIHSHASINPSHSVQSYLMSHWEVIRISPIARTSPSPTEHHVISPIERCPAVPTRRTGFRPPASR